MDDDIEMSLSLIHVSLKRVFSVLKRELVHDKSLLRVCGKNVASNIGLLGL